MNGGVLLVNGTHSGGDAYTVASGATLAGHGTISGTNTVTLNSGAFIAPGNNTSTGNAGTLTLPNLSLANNSAALFDLTNTTTAGGGTNDLVAVTGNLALNGTTAVSINLLNTSALANGDYTLFTYGTGSPATTSLVLADPLVLTSRQTYSFDYSTPGKIMLDIAGAAANLTWTGSNGASWDNTSGTTSWTNSQNNPDHFVTGDNVAFTTSNSGTVTLNATVAPGAFIVSGTYTFAGPGNITNGTALTVQSPALLTIANSGNNYTLGTAIQGGKVVLGVNNGLSTVGTLTLGTSGGSNGTFDLAGFNQTVGGLAVGAGATAAGQVITASSGSSTLTYNAGASVFGGTIQDTAGSTGGTLGLTVSSGTLDVSSGLAIYSGATTVNGGLLLAAALPNTSGISVGAAGGLGISGTNLGLLGVSNSGSAAFTGTSGTITLASLSGNGTTTFAAGASFPALASGAVTVAGPAAIGSATGGTANLNGATASITTLGNAAVNLGGSTALTVSAGSQTIAGQISGSGSLTMAGPGRLTLGGSNAYSGGTTLSAGLLAINNNSALGSGTFTIGGGTVDSTVAGVTLAGNPQNWNGDFTFAGSNPLNLGTGAVTLGSNRQVTLNAGTLTAGGPISGAGCSLTLAGSGLMVLTGSNTYSGGTWVSGGTLQVGSGGAVGSIPTASIAVLPGATLAYNLGTYTATPLSVAGNLSYTATGQLGLSGTYGGNQITATGNNVSVNGSLVINAGAGGAVISGTSSSAAGITSGGARNITANGNVTFNGVYTSSGEYTDGISLGGVYTDSTGTLTFNGIAGPGAAYGIEQGVSGSFAAGITTYGNVVFIGSGGGGSGGGHDSDINVGALTGNGTVTLIGRNRGLKANGTFTASGLPYNVVLETTNGASINGLLGAGTDTTGGGNYTINSAGSVTFGGRTINAGGGTISLTSASGYNVTANSMLQAAALVISDTSAIAISSGATLTLNTAATISNSVSGAGNLAISGGSITLAGANTYSGGTTVNGGTINVGNANAFGTSTLTINASGTPITGAAFNLYAANVNGGAANVVVNGNASLANNITVTGAGGTDNVNGFSLGGSGALTYTGTISAYSAMMGLVGSSTLSLGPGGSITLGYAGNSVFFGNPGTTLALNGGRFSSSGWNGNAADVFYNLTMNSGTASMPGGNTANYIALYANGTVRLNGGLLSVPAISGSTSNTIDFNGGTLQALRSSGTFITPSIAANIQAGGAVIDTNGYSPSIAAVLQHDPALGSSPDGGLMKIGGGQLTLAAANTYNGGTTVNNGTLQLANPAALGTGGLTVNGGELDLNANSISLPSLSGNGGTISDESTSSGTTTLTVAQAGATTFGGTVRDGLHGTFVALASSGSGMLTLAGNNTFSGGINVSGGTLQLASNNALGSGGLTANNGTVDLNGNSPTVASLSGIAGLVTVSGTRNSTLTVNQTAATTFGGSLNDGPAAHLGIEKNGTGTLVLAGTQRHGYPQRRERRRATGQRLADRSRVQRQRPGASGRFRHDKHHDGRRVPLSKHRHEHLWRHGRRPGPAGNRQRQPGPERQQLVRRSNHPDRRRFAVGRRQRPADLHRGDLRLRRQQRHARPGRQQSTARRSGRQPVGPLARRPDHRQQQHGEPCDADLPERRQLDLRRHDPGRPRGTWYSGLRHADDGPGPIGRHTAADRRKHLQRRDDHQQRRLATRVLRGASQRHGGHGQWHA